MKRIDFYISNNNHHWQMIWPVLVQLKKMNQEIRLVSLCEFRRMASPEAEMLTLGIPFIRLTNLKKKGLSSSSGRSIGGNKGLFRNILRELVWTFRLKKDLGQANKIKPILSIVPNDVAFPFNKICKWFKLRSIPFILIQEGIRFPLPNEDGGPKYGTNGALSIISWGNQSAEYFKSLGTNNHVVAIGNPRFDINLEKDYSKVVLDIKNRFSLPEFSILYVSNPIDDQGFCSHEEKMLLFKKFLDGLEKYLNDGSLKILVRLHPREDIEEFRKVIMDMRLVGKVIFVQDYPIFACIKSTQLTVVLASTVGLEAALIEKPLAVIKLPTYGYVFDYVSSGCALGIDLETEFGSEVWKVVTQHSSIYKDRSRQYANNQLSNRGSSAAIITEYILETVKGL